MFEQFSKLVHAQYNAINSGRMFRVALTGDELWEAYLAAFPEGTNPIFRERTEHDCSCCRNFIKNLGRLVAIVDGQIKTVWDIEGAPAPYDTVAKALHELVKASPIDGLFATRESRYGLEHNFELIDGKPHKWVHFHGDVPKHLRSNTPDKVSGDYAMSAQVLRRGLDELAPDALATVADLIDSKALYRGEEHAKAVKTFADLQAAYALLSPAEKNLFIWLNADKPFARFRNTVIGTLVQDLSEGMDVEKAVASFETKVAPANYKRPTAVITPRMVEAAMKTIDGLGLEPALHRRHARLSDITVNNVLWVDNAAQSQMKGGIAGLLMQEAVKPTKVGDANVEQIGIDDFMANVLPLAKSISMLVENRHTNNFVSLTAPENTGVEPLFNWDNNFAWSYNGNITDSAIRQAVQERGGRVDGVFRFSHSWNYEKRNASLMDLHVFMPKSGGTVKSGCDDNYPSGRRVGWNRREDTQSGGVQDVDYTSEAPKGYIPVENITFPSLDRMPEGTYTCLIHNWKLRNPTEGGFRAEIEFAGQLFQYEVDRPLKHKEWITVAEVTLKNGAFTIKHHLPVGGQTREHWGINTENFAKVNTVMFSPNYWDDNSTGNKHWFFMLDGCLNPDPTRGIYNEFLKPALLEHRKVFEVLGSKTKCAPVDDQLSGVGFSSTKGENVIVQVTGDKSRRTYQINF